MNKYYVLNNSLDNSMYHKNLSTDTRELTECKKFSDRKLAEKYLFTKRLEESYSVKLISNPKLNESFTADDIHNDIQSALNDSKDIIDTTIDLIELYNNLDDPSLNEEVCGYNIEDLLKRLRKVKSYMSSMAFRPTFDNSLGSGSYSSSIPNEETTSGGDSDVE